MDPSSVENNNIDKEHRFRDEIMRAMEQGEGTSNGTSKTKQSSGDGGRRCCGLHGWCSDRVTILRFVGLCFVVLLVLLCVYALKRPVAHGDHRGLEEAYIVGSPVYARDLWMVVELPSDRRGRRTRLGRAMAEHVCSAVRAGQAVGWTPLVVGGRAVCCRSRCRHLHPSDVEKMNFTSSNFFLNERNDIRGAMKTAAFLAATKHGAHFIFQANPEVYFKAGVSAEDYQTELEYQLHKMTLGISVGVVKENPSEKSQFDPYSHFGPDLRTIPVGDEDEQIHKYKICEIRPPSIEKFLDTDGFSLDVAAPPLTLPGEFSASFDSRNTLFNRDAFWSLMLLQTQTESGEEIDQYHLRSMLAQTLLAEIAGSTKFSVSKTATIGHVKELASSSASLDALNRILKSWTCNLSTALDCYMALVRKLSKEEGVLQNWHLDLTENWIADLKGIGYADFPIVHRHRGFNSPCIGNDALYGVYFHPAIQFQALPRKPKALSGWGRKNPEESDARLFRNITDKMLQRICQDEAVSLDSTGEDLDRHEDLLLIVTFHNKTYDDIPLFEVIYRHHFQNILYCGEPDVVVDDYMKRYNGLQGTYFSFLPTHTKTGYECLLGAIEMGYNVNGFLLVSADALINSWNFKDIPFDSIWHGNEHVQHITSDNINTIHAGTDDKIMRSTHGLLKALNFLEEVLLTTNDTKSELMGHHEWASKQHEAHDSHVNKRSADAGDKEATDPQLDQTEKDPITEQIKEELSEVAEHLDHILHHHGQHLDLKGDITNEELDEEYDEMMEEELAMMHDTEMKSIMDNDTEKDVMMIAKEYHIGLFGEIIPDDPDEMHEHIHEVLLNGTEGQINKEVSELLFHPANFLKEIEEEVFSRDNMSYFSDMMYDIKHTYNNIKTKLNFWQHESHGQTTKDQKLNDLQVQHFQCDVSSNSEICHLVASFFNILEKNQGDDFRLYYDDLPVYHVPAKFKDKLYLMANLFTKYQIADEVAFPLLLRGLQKTEEWVALRYFEPEKEPDMTSLEEAHYLYPVDMTSVIQNKAIRSVICRNF